jgi:hypothetical protein
MIGNEGTDRPISFDREKRFEELVLYIAERTADDPSFGTTKLAKVLFYSDVEAYRDLGASITGAEYKKWELGPYPPKLKSARRLLSAAGRITLQDVEEYEAEHMIPTSTRPADLAAVGVTPEQAAIVDAWIERFEHASANEVSRLSHEHPGYKVVGANETIPYDTAAFLADRPPTDHDVEAAKQIARKRGWLVGSRWQRH